MKVETGELLSIGRLAGRTGCRYYAAGQARDAIVIRRLRELELPLDEIAAMLHAGPATVRERLAVHRARLQGRAVEVQQLVRSLDRLIEGKEPLVQETTVEVTLEEIPAMHVAVIGARVGVDEMQTFVPDTIVRLLAWVAERGLECTSTVTFLCEPVRGIENDSLDAEVGVGVADGTTGDDVVSVSVYPAARAPVHEHRCGPGSSTTALEPGERTREIYVAHPNNTADERDYLTHVCWPVT
jgi:DNA-binding transcriptional MerR regulator